MVRNLSDEKREKFLDAALRLFVFRGIQNTTTAEIAREAGTASGTLFLYFPTKQDLLNELVLRSSREESEYIYSRLDPSATARDMFATIWTCSIHWLLDHLDAYQFSQQIRDSGLIPVEVAAETGRHFRFYYDAIQKGQLDGSIKALPVDLIGGFLYQGIVAVMNYMRLHPDPQTRDRTIQDGFRVFWDGIKYQEGN